MENNLENGDIKFSEEEKKILDTFNEINTRNEQTYIESLCDCINKLRKSGIQRVQSEFLDYIDQDGNAHEYKDSFDCKETFGRVIYEKLDRLAKQIDSGSIWGLSFLKFDLSEQQLIDIISFVGNCSLLEDLISHLQTPDMTSNFYDKISLVFIELEKENYDEETRYRVSCMLLYNLLSHFSNYQDLDEHILKSVEALFHKLANLLPNSSKEDIYEKYFGNVAKENLGVRSDENFDSFFERYSDLSQKTGERKYKLKPSIFERFLLFVSHIIPPLFSLIERYINKQIVESRKMLVFDLLGEAKKEISGSVSEVDCLKNDEEKVCETARECSSEEQFNTDNKKLEETYLESFKEKPTCYSSNFPFDGLQL